MRLKLYAFILLFSAAFLSVGVRIVFSQTETPTPTPDPSSQQSNIKDCVDNHISVADCPNFLQKKVSDLQGQEKTLSSQIGIMDNQIKLTEARIAATQAKIKALGKDIDIAKNKVSDLEDNIGKSTKALIGRIAGVYQIGSINPWEMLLTSDSISNFMTRLTYLKMVQVYDKKNIYTAEQAKNDYNNQKQIFEDKQKEQEALSKKLEDYNTQLEGEKSNKQKLLAETQGSESNYQRLLSQAKAQLAGFSRFTQSQGGASLLSGQTSCDGWGCYYNQRDSQWGGLALNGTQYSLASDGCLVTSMAMVYTHYGHRNVTPVTINSDSSNFASYYPAYLLKRIRADGALSERQWNDIDGTLASGNPVIVGISYDGGSLADHFVVFVSGSGGNYTMNDPFTPSGHNISFRGRYPNEKVVEYEKVVFL